MKFFYLGHAGGRDRTWASPNVAEEMNKQKTCTSRTIVQNALAKWKSNKLVGDGDSVPLLVFGVELRFNDLHRPFFTVNSWGQPLPSVNDPFN